MYTQKIAHFYAHGYVQVYLYLYARECVCLFVCPSLGAASACIGKWIETLVKMYLQPYVLACNHPGRQAQNCIYPQTPTQIDTHTHAHRERERETYTHTHIYIYSYFIDLFT